MTNLSEAILQKKYPSLDGLRGISIIMVVMAHLRLSEDDFSTAVFNGPMGVNIFFVISGFLITTLCLKEINLTGNLSLQKFYLRRILRILPVAYLYIVVILILNFFFDLKVNYIQFLGATFFIMNFSYFRRNHFTPMTGHYWSLSVEEQFYILFPFVLKKDRKIFSGLILFIVFILPLLCLLQEFYKPLNQGVFYAFSHYFIKFQAIAVGCMFSIFAFSSVMSSNWILTYKLAGNLIAIFLVFYLRYDDFYSIKAVYINLIISILTGYIILSNIVPGGDLIYKFLNTKFLSFIGILSYSIYIWQQIFTSNDPRLPAYMVLFPYNLIFIAIVPCLSYFLYEKYFLSLKEKFSRINNIEKKGNILKESILS